MAFDLTQLDNAQLAAAKDTDGRVLIYAGAGAGKTRVVAARVASLLDRGTTPEEHLCITFTNKAADEMAARIASYSGYDTSEMWVGTFHRICSRILRSYGRLVMIDPNFTVYDEGDQLRLLRLVMADLDVDTKKYVPKAIQGDISKLKRKKTTLQAHNAFLVKTKGAEYAEVFEKVRRAYHQAMRKTNGLDFSDLILETTRLLYEHEDVRTELSSRFRYVHVDEYQDTADVEALMVKHLSCVHQNLCVVGDARQSIYKWRGSDHTIISRFPTDYPGAKVHELGANYRSGIKIVKLGEELIDLAKDLPDYNCYPALTKDGHVDYLSFATEGQEAAGIAGMIERLWDAGETEFSGVAILCRTRLQASPIEQALLRRGIPFTKVVGAEFYALNEIKSAVCYLRLLVNPSDDMAAHFVLELLGRGVGKGTVDKLRQSAQANGQSLREACGCSTRPAGVSGSAWTSLQQFHSTLHDLDILYESGASLESLLGIICDGWIKAYCEKEALSGPDRLKNLDDMKAVAAVYPGPAKEILQNFLETVALVDSSDMIEDNKGNKVQLMTIHQAKGLEFPVVFVPGLEEEILPHGLCFSEDGGLEQERRLLYVAITRAVDRLYLSSSRLRMVNGHNEHRQPSRFVQEVLVA